MFCSAAVKKVLQLSSHTFIKPYQCLNRGPQPVYTKGYTPYCVLVCGLHVEKYITVSDIPNRLHYCVNFTVYIYIYIYRVSQEECAILRESVPYVKLYRYNPKHIYPKLNGYGDNGQISLKL